MNVAWLSFRDLQYILTIGQTLHFGRAAKECGVSQPTLSSQVKKIEGWLGYPLFERTNKAVRLTPEGLAFVTGMRTVYDSAETILGGLSIQDLLQETLRLGAIASVAPYSLPHHMTVLQNEFRDLKLMIQEGLTDGLIAALREGKLDAVIAAPTFDDHGLLAIPLYFEKFVVIAPKDEPLIQKKYIEAKDLRAEKMVLLQEGHCLTDQTLDFCPTAHRNDDQSVHAASLETLKQMVAAGMGYSVIPVSARSMPHELENRVQIRGFSNQKIGRKIVLYFRETSPWTKEATRLAAPLQTKRPKWADR